MEKTRNELLGLVKNGVSIDELYNYIKDKFEVETDKTINDFNSVIKKYKDQYILIDGNNDSFSSLMLVKEIEFSGGKTREYSFQGPIIDFTNITEDDNVNNCGISFDSFNYNHFSTESLDRKIKILSIDEVKELIVKKSAENIETIMKNFLK